MSKKDTAAGEEMRAVRLHITFLDTVLGRTREVRRDICRISDGEYEFVRTDQTEQSPAQEFRYRFGSEMWDAFRTELSNGDFSAWELLPEARENDVLLFENNPGADGSSAVVRAYGCTYAFLTANDSAMRSMRTFGDFEQKLAGLDGRMVGGCYAGITMPMPLMTYEGPMFYPRGTIGMTAVRPPAITQTKKGMACPSCGKVLERISNFCPECGAKLDTVCQSCGAAGQTGQYCMECGAVMHD